MNRWIFFLLTAVLLLPLFACAGSAQVTTATITKGDGSVERLTLDQLHDIASRNTAAYNRDYKGCPAVLEGPVKTVGAQRELIFHGIYAQCVGFTLVGSGVTVGTWDFFLTPSNMAESGADPASISPGTRVKVEGTLGEVLISATLEDAHSLVITEEI